MKRWLGKPSLTSVNPSSAQSTPSASSRPAEIVVRENMKMTPYELIAENSELLGRPRLTKAASDFARL
jgi:hypothetical protein